MAAFCFFSAWSAGAQDDPAGTRLLRYPDVHGNTVVFVYAGDLWTAEVGSEKGSATARRLTAHPGLERSPKFSPDGQWIAFNGQYDGDEQVYVIPTSGGVPRQLTFYPAQGPLSPRWGFDHQVLAWPPDGKSVLMRSVRKGWDLSDGGLYSVPVSGGLPRPLPLPESGLADLSPDGRKVVYSPVFRDFRTWKRYQGGWAQELYIFDLESHELRRVTEDVRADRDPMWAGDTIYFNSDRDNHFNLYAFDLGSSETRQLTHETKWDVRWPSADAAGRIVFELNGGLQILDTSSGKRRALDITVPDDGLASRPYRTPAADVLESFALAPDGQRALFTARGDIFTVPVEHGPTRNLTASPGAHDKHPEWSADGQSILFLSDRDGEEELYRIKADGSGGIEQLTDGGTAMRYPPRLSADGALAAFSDKDGKLYVLDLEKTGRSGKDGSGKGQLIEIADEPFGALQDHSWSPDGRFLAFSMNGANGYASIFIWSREDGRVRRVTEPEFNQVSPVWSLDGHYLYYLGDREYAPQLGNWDWNFVVNREDAVFALALTRDTPHPFPPLSDEVGQGEDDEEEEEKAQAVTVQIDFEGLSQRVARVPLPADNYSTLAATEDRLILLRSGANYYGRDSHPDGVLLAFDLEERELTPLVEKADAFALSRDGSRILVQKGSDFLVVEADAKKEDEPLPISTAGMMVDRVPSQEWAQIFDEVWRRYRDYFYVENLHGYNWEGIGKQYRALLPHVAHRDDLNYLMGEMIAELSVGHAYVAGGDYVAPKRPTVALLGGRLELDEASGRYRIAHIYQGENQEERYRSPLTEIGVEASVGDYLLAVDGVELTAEINPYHLLRNKADRPVTLTLNGKPQSTGARQVLIHPVASETNLRYLDWVSRNRQRVHELSDGRLAYLHLPNMGSAGIREFIKGWYSRLDQEGMVVDVRNNGGGNVSAMIIERMGREVLARSYSRVWDLPSSYPRVAFEGPMACILDEDSSSDGDIFPHMFREAGLGPLIGKRSWGGVIGITNRGTLIDGGSVSVPEFGFLSPEGDWIIEGHGVDPDIEVENDPKSLIEGRDPQLERAVQEVLDQLEGRPKPWTKRPEGPNKAL